jgi:hypothetical protein
VRNHHGEIGPSFSVNGCAAILMIHSLVYRIAQR